MKTRAPQLHLEYRFYKQLGTQRNYKSFLNLIYLSIS
jgi:hypothetical protein